jgi:Flp pilus assembly protein CpaB
MKRGRIFIYAALIIIIAVGAGAAYLYMHRGKAKPPTTAVATPAIAYVDIVTAGQNITPGTAIKENMLSSMQIPASSLKQGEFTNVADVVDFYAKYTIAQGVPIIDAMISAQAGNVNLPGSAWAPFIPSGLTAVSIPVTRLSSVAYGIREGDYVNVIVTMLIVDIDPAMQTKLPDWSAIVSPPGPSASGAISLTVGIASGGAASAVGHSETDTTLNQPLYLVPSEDQRPRMVTQTILQKVQVLHMGTFPLPGEAANAQYSSNPSATATPAPGQQAAPVLTTRPDIVTLMVTPQDANTLIYLVNSGAKITLTLRNPNDTAKGAPTDAAMLEYLLTQYNIPVPAKLPYGLQPRIDVLTDPKLPGDATPVP